MAALQACLPSELLAIKRTCTEHRCPDALVLLQPGLAAAPGWEKRPLCQAFSRMQQTGSSHLRIIELALQTLHVSAPLLPQISLLVPIQQLASRGQGPVQGFLVRKRAQHKPSMSANKYLRRPPLRRCE